MTGPDPLEIGDIELPADVDIEIGDRRRVADPELSERGATVVAVIEHNLRDGPTRVKLEVYSDSWGEVDALLEIEDAERFRDRLDEVIEVAQEVEQP